LLEKNRWSLNSTKDSREQILGADMAHAALMHMHRCVCVCVCIQVLYIYRHEAVLKKQNKTEIIALFSCAHKQTHTHTYKAELNESIWGFHSVTL